MSKINLKLLNESLEHWERMIDKCKWLVESGFNLYWSLIESWSVIGESPFIKDCSLCNKYYPKGYTQCDCDIYESPWRRTVKYSYTFEQFIINAEKHMIPALKRCIEIEELKEFDKEEVII